jgi:heat shock protein HslJ
MSMQRVSRFPQAFAAVALLVLAACGAPSAAAVRPAASGAPSPANPLAGHAFTSTSVTEHGRVRPLVDELALRLWFHPDGTLTVWDACNTLTGRNRVEPHTLAARLTIERAGCSAAGVAQGQWLHGFFNSGPRWSAAGLTGHPGRSGGTLVLTWRDTVIRFVDSSLNGPAPRWVPLVGPRWVVDTIYAGNATTNPPPDATAHLTFTADGRVSGSGGCNAFGGRAAATSGTITFSEVISTMMACGGGRDSLEHAVRVVLDAPRVTYVKTRDHLTLLTPHGGLRLTAS